VADALIGSCACQWPVSSWNVDAIIPIPADAQKEKIRGYNQARLLADAFSRHAHIPLEDQILRKVDNVSSQVGLSAMERKRNIKNAFHASSCEQSTLLLMDDVCTTGATMQSAAQALVEAGAKKVYGVTVARTILEKN
jgi:ComF family protein